MKPVQATFAGRARPLLAALALAGGLVSAGLAAPLPTPAAAAVGPSASAEAAHPQGRAQVFTLANGMTLIVQPDRRAPTAVHMLWVRVGSMDETDGTSGVAHVLEHMLFKGTERLAEGEFSRRVAALGGRENAFTSRDLTAYHQQVPADRLEAVMALEADRFAHNRWSDDAFAREMAVIMEERRQRVEESPPARLYELFSATAWLAHPYRRPIIGWMSDLQSLTPDDVRAFYRRWYVPANAAVVVAGDVDVAQVRAWAERHYGAIAAAPVPARKPQTEPVQQGTRRVVLKGRTQQPLLLLGYPVPGLVRPDADDPASRDALALVLLAGVLDGHSAARLERSLVQGRDGVRLADAVGAGYGLSGRGPQLFLLNAAPVAGVAPERLEAALKAEVQRIAREGVSPAELQRVQRQWAASEVFKRDSLFAQARELGSHWAQGWPVTASDTLLQRLRAVTPAQVQAVAQRYFTDDRLTAAWLLPEESP